MSATTATTGRSALAALAVVLAFALNPGCLCQGNGHIEQTRYAARPGDNVVHCACNLTFRHEKCNNGGDCLAHVELDLCLPPSLRVDGGLVVEGADLAPPPAAGDLGPDEYSQRVNAYCRDVITPTIYHMIKVFNGGWCDYKAPYAPDGGIGRSVECFAHEYTPGRGNATGRDDGTCDTPCADVACDYFTNCGEGVQDTFGTVDPDKCRCSRVTIHGCDGDPPGQLPTPLFCRAKKGTITPAP